MPTKEEILKSKNLHVNDDVIIGKSSVVQSAMEEYAKQEAVAYSYWERNHSWECDYREERSLSDDEYWNEYQKSKLKK